MSWGVRTFIDSDGFFVGVSHFLGYLFIKANVYYFSLLLIIILSA